MGMPAPKFCRKDLTSEIIAVGETVLAGMLGVSPDGFEAQLPAARRSGVSFMRVDGESGNVIGYNVATSMIGRGDVSQKHVIVPMETVNLPRGLDRRIVLGVFLGGRPEDGHVPDGAMDFASVAGWMDVADIMSGVSWYHPATFKSRMPTYAIPVTGLSPVSSMPGAVNTEQLFFTRD
jgi:hypothetical protein